MRATDDLSKIFTALGDPTRRALLARLVEGERSVSDLAEPLAMTMGAVSKHLAVLEEAGLIERSRLAQFRPCSLRADALGVAEAWLGWFRRHHEASFDRLETYLKTIQTPIQTPGGDDETR